MKYLKEDDKTFHFGTQDGEFRVVKKGLSKGALDKINKIKEQQLCGGGNVQKFKDGGGVQDTTQYDAPLPGGEDDINPGQPAQTIDRAPASVAPPVAPQEDPSLASKFGNFIGDKVIGGAVRGAGQLYDGLKNDLAPIGKFTQGVENGLGMNQPSAAPAAPDLSSKAPSVDDNNAKLAALMKQQQGQQGGQPQMPKAPDLMGQFQGAMRGYANDQMAMAKINQEGAQRDADTMGSFLQASKDHQANFEINQKAVMDRNNQLQNDITNSHVDPDRYYKNMSTSGRVMSAIGMIISGAGAGAHGTNLAVQNINTRIQQDIDSQKQDMDNKKTLFSQNMQELGNMQAAETATQSQMLAVAKGQIMQQAYQDGSANALTAAHAAIQQMNMQSIPLQQQLAQYQTNRDLMSNPNIPYEQRIMLNTALKPEQQKQMIADYRAKQIDATEKAQTNDLYDKYVKERSNPMSMVKSTPAKGALENQIMARLHKTAGIRNPETLHKMADAYLGNRLDATGTVGERKNNMMQELFPPINSNVGSYSPNIPSGEDEGQ